MSFQPEMAKPLAQPPDVPKLFPLLPVKCTSCSMKQIGGRDAWLPVGVVSDFFLQVSGIYGSVQVPAQYTSVIRAFRREPFPGQLGDCADGFWKTFVLSSFVSEMFRSEAWTFSSLLSSPFAESSLHGSWAPGAFPGFRVTPSYPS